MTQVQISFPGLGIEPFTVDKVAFSVFGFDVRWYGILITLGMIFAFAYALYRSKREGFAYDDVLDMGLYIVIFGVIGARLYYVLMKWDNFVLADRSFWENLKAIFNIRGGGLAIYGGVIAGALTIILYSRIKKKNWLGALDMVAPGVMVAQALGRWGNFFNGEAHGGLVEADHALAFLRMGLYPNDLHTAQMAYVHPTFLYESLWNILGFLLIHFLIYPRKRFQGQVAMSYLAWYGFGRMLIEGLRTDSLYIGPIRVSQLVGGLCFVVFAALIVVMYRKAQKAELCAAGEDYVPMYGTLPTQKTTDADRADVPDPAPAPEADATAIDDPHTGDETAAESNKE